LWSVPVLDRLAEEADVKPYELPALRAWAPRFNASSLFYLSSRGAGDGLWRHQNGEVREIWRGEDGALLWSAAVSLDGGRVAFGLRRNGVLRVHVMGSGVGDLQPVGSDIQVLGGLSWSPDGKWIVTGSEAKDGPGLFKIPVDGGAPVRLVKDLVLNPVWSPDGTMVVYAGVQVGLSAPLLAIRPDGASADLPQIQLRREGERLRFSADGKSLIYMQGQLASQDFWQLDFATKQTRRLTRLTEPSTMRTFDITPDGKQILFDRQRENSEVRAHRFATSVSHEYDHQVSSSSRRVLVEPARARCIVHTSCDGRRSISPKSRVRGAGRLAR
jgi:Tol biopolymer transport system component